MGSNPYVGPRPFEPSEAAWFFGRDDEAEEVLTLLMAERIVLLFSPSGAGKTSLIQARLLRQLTAQGFDVLPTLRVGADPAAAPRYSPNRYVESVAVRWSVAPRSTPRLMAAVAVPVTEVYRSR